MNVRRMRIGAAFGGAAILGVLVGSFASCAESVDAEPTEEDAASSLPETSASGESDAGVAETGCHDSDAGCTAEIVPCEAVSWCLVPTSVNPVDMLTGIWGSSKDDVWAVGSGGTIIHYDGSAWTATSTNLLNTFHAVWGTGPNDVWVVSSTGVILHSTGFTNGTATWTNVPTTASPALQPTVRAVWASSPEDVRIGGVPANVVIDRRSERSHQFRKTVLPDGGTTWRPIPGVPTVTSIWGSSASDVWMTADNSATVVHERGLTFHGTPSDAGPDAADPLRWTPVDSQSVNTLEVVWGTSASDVWAVGAQGTVRRIGALDKRWQKLEAPTTETLRGVWGSGPNDIWIVGDSGTILHYDGTKIEPSSAQLPLGSKPSLRGIWGSGPNDIWIVGEKATLHYTGPKASAQGAGGQ